jgi:hypothetical protein
MSIKVSVEAKCKMVDLWVTFASGILGYLDSHLFPEEEIEAWNKTVLTVTFQILRIYFADDLTLPAILKASEEGWTGLVSAQRAHKEVVHHPGSRPPRTGEAMKKLLEAIKIKGEKKANVCCANPYYLVVTLR